MLRLLQVVRLLLAFLLLLTMPAATAWAAPAAIPHAAPPEPLGPDAPTIVAGAASCAPDVLRPNGSHYRICVPAVLSAWSGDLIVFAHGYVNSGVANGTIPEDQLRLGGVYTPDTAASFGYAFAVTSYPMNGLVVREAIPDLADLVSYFRSIYPQTHNIYLVGVSEGGLITALSAERYAAPYSGALAICGPVGDFIMQGNYFTDFRIVFDYFFPGVMQGTPIAPAVVTTQTWASTYVPQLTSLMLDPANAGKRNQLFTVTNAPFDLDPHSYVTSTLDALWYNTFATRDAIAKIGGSPFDNIGRHYSGSNDDAALNAWIDAHNRYAADPAAVAEVNAHYQTNGRLLIPVVTLHTTLDQQVPFSHEALYATKVAQAGRSFIFTQYEVPRYGHCNLTAYEIMVSLNRAKELAAMGFPRAYMSLARK